MFKQHKMLLDSEMIESLLAQAVERALPRLGAWAARTRIALPASENTASGWRDRNPIEQGHAWRWPRSNAAERIEAYLWLATRLDDARYREHAIAYAKAMSDPTYGIYQGEEEDGRGQVWYWRDVGLYMTNYTMRVPPAFLEIAAAAHEPRFRELALLSGQQLLRSQRPCGIFREGWLPEHPGPGVHVPSPEQRDELLSPVKINVRVGYVCRALSELFHATNDPAYRTALEHFAHALEQCQYPDGSFPADIRTDRIGVHDPCVKGHFLYYILNGLAVAAVQMPDLPILGRMAERLGRYILGVYRRSWGCPYGNLDVNSESEHVVWRSATPDAVYGLAWLSRLTGDTAFREAACLIALHTLLTAFDCPENPDSHGGVPVWVRSDRYAIGGHFHFWALLGLKALEATSPHSDCSARALQTV